MKSSQNKQKLKKSDSNLFRGVDINHLLSYIEAQYIAGVDITLDYKHYLDYIENYELRLDDFYPFDFHFKDENIMFIQFEFRINGLRVGTKIIRDYAIKYSSSDIYKLNPFRDSSKGAVVLYEQECESKESLV